MSKYTYFEATDEIFQKFDNYEIMPCVLLGQDDSGNDYESCNADNPDIAIWCVYGHFQTGGLECISDHKTYDESKRFMETLPEMPFRSLTPF
ncbi:MAG: hypothetical protein IPL17_23780 [Anaerolineales bacterium]|nr:hypothetical protein [Anaerolineales bacterium]